MPLRSENWKIALVLITTKSELLSGDVKECIDRYVESVSENRLIDIIISLNTDVDSSQLDYIKNNKSVNSLDIHNCNIPAEEDIYTHDDKVDVKHELGQSNGPNQSFYRTFDYLKSKSHDFFMVIETDSRPMSEYWLDGLVHYCNMKEFIIGGSRYKGKQKLPDSEWRDHLNGIALYKNCDELYDIMKGSKELLYRYIHKKAYARLNYDIAIWYYVNSPEGAKYLSQVIDTNIIANYSLPCDSGISEKDILAKHPYTIILHQKT